MITQEVQVKHCDFRHWHDSPQVFSCILPKDAIIMPQMTNNTTINMAFRSSFPSGDKTISFLPMLKIKCTVLAPSTRCLTSKLPFLVRTKMLLLSFFQKLPAVLSSLFYYTHLFDQLETQYVSSAQKALSVYTQVCARMWHLMLWCWDLACFQYIQTQYLSTQNMSMKEKGREDRRLYFHLSHLCTNKAVLMQKEH